MKDIHEVLRRKQAKYAQLSKQIEALQQAAEKLREVAPLLAENDDEESTVLAEVEDQGTAWRHGPDRRLRAVRVPLPSLRHALRAGLNPAGVESGHKARL